MSEKKYSGLHDRAVAVHGDKYDYGQVDWNKGWKTLQRITCPTHGTFQQSLSNHICNKRGCPECGGSKRKTTVWFIREARKIHGNKYDYSKSVYVNWKTPIKIICPKHGEFHQPSMKHITRKFGCPFCAGRKSNRELWLEKAKHLHGDEYSYTNTTYHRNTDYVTITCKEHGDFEVLSANHVNPAVQSRCPKCTYVLSKPQKFITDILDSIQVNYILNDRRKLSGMEIDVLIPAANLAIEIDGVYWHSELAGKDRYYHIEKTLALKRFGIQLLHFWDYEIQSKPDLVKSMILYKLGISKRVHARLLIKEELTDKDEVSAFLRHNHLGGSSTYHKAYGLRSRKTGRLAAVLTISKPYISQEFEWEVKRFATHQGVSVVGGASRLWGMFLKDLNPSSVVSYADLRYSNGKLYRQLGFKFLRRSKPSYFWSAGGSYSLSRYQTQKGKLSRLLGKNFDPNVSEKQNMEQAGYTRVFDCGTLVYVWKKQ